MQAKCWGNRPEVNKRADYPSNFEEIARPLRKIVKLLTLSLSREYDDYAVKDWADLIKWYDGFYKFT